MPADAPHSLNAEKTLSVFDYSWIKESNKNENKFHKYLGELYLKMYTW